MSNTQQNYNDVIDHAIKLNGDGLTFLYAWREGDWSTCENEFGFKISDDLKFPKQPTAITPQNTTVTITYSNGETREFIASDDLEKMINEGEMFSVTTMHSDMNIDEEYAVSKMYAGNPIAAMGYMMMMHRNAQDMSDDSNKKIILEVLSTCIAFLKDEVTSHQSGMVKVDDEKIKIGPVVYVKDEDANKYRRAKQLLQEMFINCRDNQTVNQHNPYSWAELNQNLMKRLEEFMMSGDTETEGHEYCPVINRFCEYCSYQCDSNGEVAICHCGHPENSKDEEGNCTSLLCPLCTCGGG